MGKQGSVAHLIKGSLLMAIIVLQSSFSLAQQAPAPLQIPKEWENIQNQFNQETQALMAQSQQRFAAVKANYKSFEDLRTLLHESIPSNLMEQSQFHNVDDFRNFLNGWIILGQKLWQERTWINKSFYQQGQAPMANYTKTQLLRAQEITSYYENSTISFQYDYIENLGDGRGYTGGRVGFCSGTGDMVLVVGHLCETNPMMQTCKYLPRLVQLENEFNENHGTQNISDVTGLEGLPAAWQADSDTPATALAMQAAQDYVVDQLYLYPALRIAYQVGARSAMGAAIIYDSIIQHGGGDQTSGNFEGDGLWQLILRTNKQVLGPAADPKTGTKFPTHIDGISDNELRWLNAFLTIRRQDLVNPYDKTTQEVWAESVNRVDSLRGILDEQKDVNLQNKAAFDKVLFQNEHDDNND
jgi:chitosanase